MSWAHLRMPTLALCRRQGKEPSCWPGPSGTAKGWRSLSDCMTTWKRAQSSWYAQLDWCGQQKETYILVRMSPLGSVYCSSQTYSNNAQIDTTKAVLSSVTLHDWDKATWVTCCEWLQMWQLVPSAIRRWSHVTKLPGLLVSNQEQPCVCHQWDI